MTAYTINNGATFDVKQYLHPMTNSRFVVAVIAVLPIILWIAYMSFNNRIFFIFVSAYTALLFLAIWIGMEFTKALLVGNAVKVGHDNFPQIATILESVKDKIGYHKDVEIYIVESGTVNMILHRFFSTKFIVIHSSFVESCDSAKNYRDIEWAIARFVGYMKVKKDHYFPIVFEIMEAIKKFPILNLLVLPYERCIIYSGDRIGLALCGEVEAAITGISKLLIGKALYGKVSSDTFIFQSRIVNSSFFAGVARFFSSYPHMTDRYLNIMAFVKETVPEHYLEFVTKHHIDRVKLEEALRDRHGR
ncbi:M48 family metallopeptidase [Azospirillum sp. A1-3]|uniref:M48 family metallopeptidase n=1 Tax=Azospirillum sp. A1-3 TaxID=185874 RepID=UPI0020771E25|nr:M48 family metallopeptidase [Azospirillum sp. A1-3]MCM8736740.1 M48 family metallopeptidase [Azospirillum sp. A1-3]